jgi:uncharacterized protein YjbI with pentapeptide repeats
MADKTQVALLKQGVQPWNEWRAAHRGQRVDLSNAHLYGLDLVGVDLSGADLRNSDLRGATLIDANLAGADLRVADFFRTVLDGADLSGANLHGARFLGCPQLVAARNWQSCPRDPELGCDAPIPAGREGS